jgi:UDP-glucose 4-epimerase
VKNILITGGMGFIGKFLVRKLLSERDYDLTIVDNLSSSKVDEQIAANPRVTFVNESFENWTPPDSAQFHQIYHLTSPVGPLGVLKYKGRIGEMILGQLYHAAEFAMKMDAKLLEISTSEVYGQHPDNEQEGQREDIDKIVPSNLTVRLEYGVAKLLCEIVLKNLSRDNKLDYICIRPFNIVGPKQNGDLGFIIPRFLKQAASGNPLTVYGDGSQKRTFTHVQDFVDAIFLTMESDRTGEIYNVGNPDNVTTVLNLAEKIKAVTKTSSEISFVDPVAMYKDFAEAWNKIPNIDKISAHTGWQPKYSLEFIVKEVAEMGDSYLISK